MSTGDILTLIGGGLASYLLGAIPFSLLLGFLVGGVDIRNVGSGNTGATNLARAVNYPAGFGGLLLDFTKGFVPAFWLAPLLGNLAGLQAVSALQWTGVTYGFLAIVGHCFPVYLNFSGGKGVATSLGVFIALAPITTSLAFGVWLITLLVGGWVSLGSIVGSASLPVLYFLYHNVIQPSPDHAGIGNPVFLFGILAATLVVARHHENIARLISGEEEKFYEPLKTSSD